MNNYNFFVDWKSKKTPKGGNQNLYIKEEQTTQWPRYQRGNQNLYIKEEQTTQWTKDTKGAIRICISKKNRQHNGQKIPKGQSESVYQRRTVNTMVKRYQRGNQNLYIKEEQTTQWTKDTKGAIRICISKKNRQHNGQKISKGQSESVYQRRTDNTMDKRYQRGNQNLYIKEEQSTQWSKDTKGAIRICISKKNRQHNGQKTPKGQSESVYQRRTDNTMVKRYQRGNQNLYIKEQTTQWSKDTKGVIRICISKKNRQHNGQKIPKEQSESVYQRRTDNTMAKRYQRGNQNLYIKEEQTTQWPKDTKGVIRICISKKNRQHNGQKIPKGQSESVYQRRTDNTMAKRYQRGNQNLYIKEEQTTQWPKDSKGAIRICISKKNKQHNGQKISKGQSESVYQRRTNNTMAKRYQRSNQNLYIKEEQTTQWPKDTKGAIRIYISKKNSQHNGQKIPKGQSESIYQRRTDNTMAKRYQRGNQNLYIKEEQATQWTKENVQKDKQRSTKHTCKTEDRVTRTPLKTGREPESVYDKWNISMVICDTDIP